jgi:hypothetical protein
MPPITEQRPGAAPVAVTPRVHRVEKPAKPSEESLDTLAAAIEDSLTPAAEDMEPAEGEQVETVEEDVSEDDPDSDVYLIEVDRTRCLSCGHLVAWAEKFYDNCHYSKGNENCTAQNFRIKLAVPVERLGRKLAEAEHLSDAETAQRTMNKIVEQQRKGNLSADDYRRIIKIRDETLIQLRTAPEEDGE